MLHVLLISLLAVTSNCFGAQQLAREQTIPLTIITTHIAQAPKAPTACSERQSLTNPNITARRYRHDSTCKKVALTACCCLLTTALIGCAYVIARVPQPANSNNDFGPTMYDCQTQQAQTPANGFNDSCAYLMAGPLGQCDQGDVYTNSPICLPANITTLAQTQQYVAQGLQVVMQDNTQLCVYPQSCTSGNEPNCQDVARVVTYVQENCLITRPRGRHPLVKKTMLSRKKAESKKDK